MSTSGAPIVIAAAVGCMQSRRTTEALKKSLFMEALELFKAPFLEGGGRGPSAKYVYVWLLWISPWFLISVVVAGNGFKLIGVSVVLLSHPPGSWV